MLGCIQPISSPMMNRMLGLVWSCAWTIAVLPRRATPTVVAAAIRVIAAFMSLILPCQNSLAAEGPSWLTGGPRGRRRASRYSLFGFVRYSPGGQAYAWFAAAVLSLGEGGSGFANGLLNGRHQCFRLKRFAQIGHAPKLDGGAPHAVVLDRRYEDDGDGGALRQQMPQFDA